MKIKGIVVSKADYRRGRSVAKWIASGCNWADGEGKTNAMKMAKDWLQQPETLVAIGTALRLSGAPCTQSLAASFTRASEEEALSWVEAFYEGDSPDGLEMAYAIRIFANAKLH